MCSRRWRGYIYLVYRIGECGMGRYWRLVATITPLLRSMCGSGILWCLTGTWCCYCLLHLAYVLAISVYGGAWQTPGHMCCYRFVYAVLVFSACCTVAICEVGCLARTWCKSGVALVNFQTFPISCGVTGHVCSLRDMYAWTPDKVNFASSDHKLLI